MAEDGDVLYPGGFLLFVIPAVIVCIAPVICVLCMFCKKKKQNAKDLSDEYYDEVPNGSAFGGVKSSHTEPPSMPPPGPQFPGPPYTPPGEDPCNRKNMN